MALEQTITALQCWTFSVQGRTQRKRAAIIFLPKRDYIYKDWSLVTGMLPLFPLLHPNVQGDRFIATILEVHH